jgi:hypothetical protein
MIALNKDVYSTWNFIIGVLEQLYSGRSVSIVRSRTKATELVMISH